MLDDFFYQNIASPSFDFSNKQCHLLSLFYFSNKENFVLCGISLIHIFTVLPQSLGICLYGHMVENNKINPLCQKKKKI